MSSPTIKGRYAAEIDVQAQAWLSIFREVPAWVVCPHMRPDADTLGSSLALARLIRALGRRADVVCADAVLPQYAFLPGAEQVLVNRLPDDLPEGWGVVTLDAAELDRLGRLATLVADRKPFVNLDHHVSNQRFGTHNWVDLRSAATGELVYLLYDYFGVAVDAEAAQALYAALVTDTGFFRYPATTARTLAIASALVGTGIDFPGLIGEIYERKRVAAVKLLGLALAELRLEAGGRVAWTSVSKRLLAEAGAEEDESEGIVEMLRAIDGVEVLYILREAEHEVRVSLRAKGDHDVNAIARHFGGGGHSQAAGCVIAAPLEEAERQLRDVVLAHLEKRR